MSHSRSLSSLVAGCCAALLVAAGAAVAQTPITAGPGNYPRVAVDAAGAGYLTWVEGSTSTFRFCKLPAPAPASASATACTSPFRYVDANQDLDGGYALLPGDGRVLLLDARGVTPARQKLLFTSGDGGTTFGAPAQIAAMSATGSNITGSAFYVPAGRLGLASEAIFTLGQLAGVTAAFQASGTGPGSADALAELTPHVATSAAIQDNVLLAVLSDFGQVSWTRYAGPVPATIESLNAAANWSVAVPIGPRFAAQLETRLVSGPGGAYLGYTVDNGATDEFVIRRWDGSTFGAPTAIARNINAVDLYEGSDGRLHLLYTDQGGLRYRYTTTSANTAWSTVQSVATGLSVAFPRLAVSAAGNGWATWVGTDGVQAVPLRGEYVGPQTGVETSGSGATYRLGVPQGCVAPGQRFRVTLTWKRQKRKGNLFVKVRRTDFYLGARRLRTDTTAPFVHTYDVRVTQPPGSTLSLRARAFIKVRQGKEPKKSVFARVKVCSP